MAGQLAQLATALGFPIFAEASSQMRFALRSHPLAARIRLAALLGGVSTQACSDQLLCLGATPTCSDFERWALDSGASRYVLCEHESPDPLGTARVIAHGDLALSLDVLQREIASINRQPHARQRAFAAALLESGRACQTLVSEELACEAGLAEGAAVACIAQALPNGAQWVLGNSLPIRDVDATLSVAPML